MRSHDGDLLSFVYVTHFTHDVCLLQLFHRSISAQLSVDVLPEDLQQLQEQLDAQRRQYADLAQQIELLEAITRGHATAFQAGQLHLKARHAAANSPEHKLAVIVPYRDREQHLAKLIDRLTEYLTVSQNF